MTLMSCSRLLAQGFCTFRICNWEQPMIPHPVMVEVTGHITVITEVELPTFPATKEAQTILPIVEVSTHDIQ